MVIRFGCDRCLYVLLSHVPNLFTLWIVKLNFQWFIFCLDTPKRMQNRTTQSTIDTSLQIESMLGNITCTSNVSLSPLLVFSLCNSKCWSHYKAITLCKRIIKFLGNLHAYFRCCSQVWTLNTPAAQNVHCRCKCIPRRHILRHSRACSSLMCAHRMRATIRNKPRRIITCVLLTNAQRMCTSRLLDPHTKCTKQVRICAESAPGSKPIN